jgi:hypothetical protein
MSSDAKAKKPMAVFKRLEDLGFDFGSCDD